MKRLLCFIIVILVLMTSFCSCSPEKKTESTRISIVTTIFPEYDFVMQILGEKKDNFDVTMLLDSGVDLHSFQPTVDDMVKISDCDLFVYIGGESDEWVEDTLKNSNNKNQISLNLMDTLKGILKEEETAEGMQEEKEENEEEENGTEYDEHIWLSLKNAVRICEALKEKIVLLDGKNKDIYENNTDEYIEKLNTLDKKFEDTVKMAKRKTLLFCDRFPFRYLTDDYNLSYYAAFKGCSAESEASFETVNFLAEKIDELKLPYVLILEGSNKKIANTVINESKNKNAQIISINSMQSITDKELENKTSYIDIMNKNLEALKKALE